MQLLLIVRAVGCTQTVGRLVLDSTTSVPDALTVTQVFLLIAQWLGQVWAGHNESELFSGLRLLRLSVDTNSPEINEAAHRLWCSLTDEQRAQAPIRFEAPFYCPFVQSGIRASAGRCPCGSFQQHQKQPAATSRPSHYGYPTQPTPYGTPSQLQPMAAPAHAPLPLFSSPSGPMPPPAPPSGPHHAAGILQPGTVQPIPPGQSVSAVGTPPLPPTMGGPGVQNAGYATTMTRPSHPPSMPPSARPHRPPTGFNRPWAPESVNQLTLPPPPPVMAATGCV
ncbi:unnamed protein product [Echinostoma caproni]|uniref:Zinc finger MIZ domain-containing protein 1 n=1 Tax=Echinostoma caproni TaxID=27848 RepID=A0A182ZZZ1_9TREM|nr:unnamed protein product [Echinostoma caproni]